MKRILDFFKELFCLDDYKPTPVDIEDIFKDVPVIWVYPPNGIKYDIEYNGCYLRASDALDEQVGFFVCSREDNSIKAFIPHTFGFKYGVYHIYKGMPKLV